MDNTNVFYVDINGKKVVAEVLVTFTFYNNTYCVYSIKNGDTGLNDVYSAKLLDNVLINIDDLNEKQIIDTYIYNMLSIVKER